MAKRTPSKPRDKLTNLQEMRASLALDRTPPSPMPIQAAELLEFHLWLYNHTAHRGQVELWRAIKENAAAERALRAPLG
jgi:hypothetical protein